MHKPSLSGVGNGWVHLTSSSLASIHSTEIGGGETEPTSSDRQDSFSALITASADDVLKQARA